jgi:hypothetical protein
MAKKYSDDEKRLNRRSYLKSRTGDLQTYQSMIGQGFESKIDLLGQLIRDKHDASLQRYKERLLVDCLRRHLPGRFKVGDGFVVFPEVESIPTESDLVQRNVPIKHNRLATTNHEISNQLEINIYDSIDYPCIFRDGDFVVLLPESVRAVIEVKGVLTLDEVRKTSTMFIDYGTKFKKYREFVKCVGLRAVPRDPILLMMAWTVGVDGKGRKKVDGKRLRQRILSDYKQHVSEIQAIGFPVLGSAYIYNDCEVHSTYWPGDEPFTPSFGFFTSPGYFVRRNENGEIARIGDSTIASLLRRVQYQCSDNNSFLGSVEKELAHHEMPHEHQGYDCWIENMTPKKREDS